MGLNCSGDEYCARGDRALSGLKNIKKVVDDILVFGPSFKDMYESVRAVLTRCHEHGITLSPKKFVFGKREVSYVGFKISADGIQPDPAKLAAIREFPKPKNVTDLRSFFGLANQLGSFSLNVTTAVLPLRPLLSTKNAFMWLKDVHDPAFDEARQILSSPPVLAHFNPVLPIKLLTDASRLQGLGFALMQDHGTEWRMIQCGSRFVSDTESRYAAVNWNY